MTLRSRILRGIVQLMYKCKIIYKEDLDYHLVRINILERVLELKRNGQT